MPVMTSGGDHYDRIHVYSENRLIKNGGGLFTVRQTESFVGHIKLCLNYSKIAADIIRLKVSVYEH